MGPRWSESTDPGIRAFRRSHCIAPAVTTRLSLLINHEKCDAGPGVTDPDTLFIPIGRFGTLLVPHAALWDFAASACSGLVIAFSVYLLARRQFCSERWYERQVECYSEIMKALFVLKEGTKKLAAEESREDPKAPKPYSPEELKQAATSSRMGDSQLLEHLQLRRFFLSPRAIAVLDTYFADMKSEEYFNTTAPSAYWDYCARRAYQDFHELAQVDLGQRTVVWRGSRQLRRWAAQKRYLLRDRFAVWRIMRDIRRQGRKRESKR
jgi:hypothetical protein